MTDEPDPETAELKQAQVERETQEHQLAKDATEDHETAQHERRADKAGYLREKLAEREASERQDDS
jgi:hypothetical protein